MKIIINNRRMGKTKALLEHANRTDSIIICLNENQKENIREMAERLSLAPPTIMTKLEFDTGCAKGMIFGAEEHPCDRCKEDRRLCGGYPPKEDKTNV